jgi:uncharacterized protein YhbP (UPF0306 family)
MDIEQIIRQNIDKTIHLSLATTRDNKPWVCEVHFAYDHELTLYFRSLLSRRHSQEIAANPNVAGNIVKQHDIDEYPTGIYFEGLAQLLEAGDEQTRAFELLRNRVGAGDGALSEATRDDGHKFYKITVTNWYAFGKFGQPSGQKYELAWNGGHA